MSLEHQGRMGFRERPPQPSTESRRTAPEYLSSHTRRLVLSRRGEAESSREAGAGHLGGIQYRCPRSIRTGEAGHLRIDRREENGSRGPGRLYRLGHRSEPQRARSPRGVPLPHSVQKRRPATRRRASPSIILLGILYAHSEGSRILQPRERPLGILETHRGLRSMQRAGPRELWGSKPGHR